jgi:hypothetical protein
MSLKEYARAGMVASVLGLTFYMAGCGDESNTGTGGGTGTGGAVGGCPCNSERPARPPTRVPDSRRTKATGQRFMSGQPPVTRWAAASSDGSAGPGTGCGAARRVCRRRRRQ